MAGRHREIVSYKECRRNHALAAGGNTVDGCREFTAAAPAGEDGAAAEEALLCQACGCHRSFHRREVALIRAHHNHPPPPPPPPPVVHLAAFPAVPLVVLHRAPVNVANPNHRQPQPRPPAPAQPPRDDRERDRAEIDGEIDFESQKPTVQVMKRTRRGHF